MIRIESEIHRLKPLKRPDHQSRAYQQHDGDSHLTDRKELCLPMFEKVLRLVEKDGQPPIRGYWDTLENLCKYWFEHGDYKKVIAYADQRASPKAVLNGRSYPSLPAMRWKKQALAALAK